jgi:hypothetical protein
MARLITLAKGTAAFLIVAVGGSFIIGSLMGGGFSRSYDELKGLNTDPRSVLVQGVLIEVDSAAAQPAALPAPGSALTDAAFNGLLAEADRLRAGGAARVRTPAVLVQHAETGSITVKLGDRTFDAAISPSVIDTKHGPVLRVAIHIQRIDTDSADTPRELTFATAYTAAPGGAVVLDLAELGLPGTRAVLALRTTMSDPTPRASN